LDDNEPGLRIYRRLGFRQEGLLRQAAFKRGRLRDVVVMSILRSEFGEAS
jgi:RimJ/RimL family protein N-acetyltransferase